MVAGDWGPRCSRRTPSFQSIPGRSRSQSATENPPCSLRRRASVQWLASTTVQRPVPRMLRKPARSSSRLVASRTLGAAAPDARPGSPAEAGWGSPRKLRRRAASACFTDIPGRPEARLRRAVQVHDPRSRHGDPNEPEDRDFKTLKENQVQIDRGGESQHEVPSQTPFPGGLPKLTGACHLQFHVGGALSRRIERAPPVFPLSAGHQPGTPPPTVGSGSRSGRWNWRSAPL